MIAKQASAPTGAGAAPSGEEDKKVATSPGNSAGNSRGDSRGSTPGNSPGNSPGSTRLRRSFSVRKALLQQASSLALHRQNSDTTTVPDTNEEVKRRRSWTPVGIAGSDIELLVASEEKDNGTKVSSANVLATLGLFGEKLTGRAKAGSTIFESSLDLTPERIGHIFHTLDTNKDGVVSYESLKRGIEEWAGIGADAIDEATFTTLTSFLDTDKSGDISLVEFSEGLRLLTMHILFTQSDTPGTQFECFDYSAMQYQRNIIQEDVSSQAEFMYGSREDFVSCRWINVGGNGPEASLTLQRLAVKYLLHPLAIEDAFYSSDHRPKVEVFSSHYFLQIPFFTLIVGDSKSDDIEGGGNKDSNEANGHPFHITYEIISIFVNVPFNDTLITFQRRRFDDPKGCQFANLREQIKKSYSKLRQYSAQYLAYALLDMAVDRLPEIAERVAKCIEAERNRQRVNGYEDASHIVEAIKENLRKTLRQIKPFLRVLNHVIQDDNIVPGATLYLRDVRDNLECAQDDLRELVNSCDQLDVEYEKYHARQQDKTLYLMTVVTSIFLPAQFLTGVWGMNFTDMPELKQAWGYPLFWVLCRCV